MAWVLLWELPFSSCQRISTVQATPPSTAVAVKVTGRVRVSPVMVTTGAASTSTVTSCPSQGSSHWPSTFCCTEMVCVPAFSRSTVSWHWPSVRASSSPTLPSPYTRRTASASGAVTVMVMLLP